MPYKTGDLKGQLTAPELRRMIKAHNKLVSINIPPKTDRDGLIKLIEDAGYKIDHAKQVLRVDKVVRKKNIKLPPPPTPKTAEEKKQAKDKKDAKAKAVSDEKKLIKQDAKTEGIKQAVALKKVRGMKIKPKPKVKDLRADVLKFIKDHKAWLTPSRMSDPYKNSYNYYLKTFKDAGDDSRKLKMLVNMVEMKIERFKTGTNAGGVINPFNKKGGLPMPKKSYKFS